MTNQQQQHKPDALASSLPQNPPLKRSAATLWKKKEETKTNKILINKGFNFFQKRITGQVKIDERGDHLGAGLRMGVSGNGLRREAVEGPTERASPGPLLQFTVRVEVCVTVLATRKHMTVGSVDRSCAVLVLRREWRHRHAPWQTRSFLRVRVGWKPWHRGSNRHGSEISF